MTRTRTAATADAARVQDHEEAVTADWQLNHRAEDHGDEGGGDAADAAEAENDMKPKSVVRNNMTCRVAVMEAAAENMPIDAPYGHVSSRVKAMNEKLAQVCTPDFPNGIHASDTVLCHQTNGIIAVELKAFETRSRGEQFFTGDNLGDANADLNAACQSAQIALDENLRFKQLSDSDKKKELDRKEAAMKEATMAREAGAMGLSQATMDARGGGVRTSPIPKAMTPAELFEYGSSSSSSSSNAPPLPSAADKLVSVMQEEVKSKTQSESAKAEIALKTEARLQIEGEARAKERAEELSISKNRAESEMSVAEKRMAHEAARGVEDCKRLALESKSSAEVALLKATSEASALESKTAAEAHSMMTSADAAAAATRATAEGNAAAEQTRAQAALEDAKARSAMAAAQVQQNEIMKMLMGRMMPGAAP